MSNNDGMSENIKELELVLQDLLAAKIKERDKLDAEILERKERINRKMQMADWELLDKDIDRFAEECRIQCMLQ